MSLDRGREAFWLVWDLKDEWCQSKVKGPGTYEAWSPSKEKWSRSPGSLVASTPPHGVPHAPSQSCSEPSALCYWGRGSLDQQQWYHLETCWTLTAHPDLPKQNLPFNKIPGECVRTSKSEEYRSSHEGAIPPIHPHPRLLFLSSGLGPHPLLSCHNSQTLWLCTLPTTSWKTKV